MTPALRTALITGAAGQIGRALRAAAPGGWRVVGCNRAALDVTHPESVARVMERERPVLVINAAAYTGVDSAEREAERAEKVNGAGPAHLAEEARRTGARLIHLSTNYVFDGARGRPYEPDDRPNPLGVYGRTKLAGEREAARISGGEALVVRTGWVYAAEGRNFVHSVLRLMRERDSVEVVADQIGTPTWARSVASAVWAAATRPALRGILHWTDTGVASRYDFAVAIQEEAAAAGLLERCVPIRPIRTRDYPTPARRPPFSVLDPTLAYGELGLEPAHWRMQLRAMLREVAAA